MFFKKDEYDNLRARFLQVDVSDQRRLAQLQRDLEKLLPDWSAIQERCELLAARYNSTERCYTREVCESFWARRDPQLKEELDALIRQRDALTGDLPARIVEAKERIHARCLLVSGSFTSWANSVQGQLPPVLAADLARVRAQVQAEINMAEILSTAEEWVARIGERSDELSVSVPVLNLTSLLRRCLAEPAA